MSEQRICAYCGFDGGDHEYGSLCGEVNALRAALERVTRERDDYEHRLALLLDHCTDGRASKTNYSIETMRSLVDDAADRWQHEELEHTRRQRDEAVEALVAVDAAGRPHGRSDKMGICECEACCAYDRAAEIVGRK